MGELCQAKEHDPVECLPPRTSMRPAAKDRCVSGGRRVDIVELERFAEMCDRPPSYFLPGRSPDQ